MYDIVHFNNTAMPANKIEHFRFLESHIKVDITNNRIHYFMIQHCSVKV